MAGPPALCSNPACKHVFEVAQLFGGSGSADIQISGSRTWCPRCGAPADIAEGSFRYSNNNLRFIDGPMLTRDLVERLAKIADAARHKVTDTEELLAEIADVSPEFAQKIRDRGLPYFLIALLLIWLVKSVSLDITIDVNRLIDQVQDAADGYEGEDILDAPLPTAPDETHVPGQPIWVDQQAAPMSRQVRRQLERQSKKAQRRGGTKQA